MSSQPDKNEKKLTISAPRNSDASVPGAVLSVEIGVDEEVEWVWTHFENGRSAVTGYTLIKKDGPHTA